MLLCLVICPALVLTACKRVDKPVAGASSPPAASASAASVASAAPTIAPGAAGAVAPGTPAAAVPPFDVSGVPVSTVTLPPFPVIALPKGIDDGYHNKEIEFERMYVLAGQQLRPVEGHLSERFFPLSVIKMSPLAAFRNYDDLIKSIGGVRVNTAQPGDQAFIAQNGGDRKAILTKLRLLNLEDTMPNEVPTFVQYLVRTPTTNIWISFSFFDDANNVELVVLEEKALQQNVGPVTANGEASFPYVTLPNGIADGYHNKEIEFERMYVLDGQQLRAVEGHLSERFFPLSVIKMSTLAAFRNYDAIIKSIGGVRVNTVQPGDQAFIAQNGGDRKAILTKLRLLNLEDTMPHEVPTFVQYVVRKPTSNVWITFSFFDDGLNGDLVVLEEKALEQKVGLVTADAMASALKQDGHIALYLNFDTDSDVVRPDSLPVVAQIVKLLEQDKKLALKIEGHTDNSGDAAHNRALSLARAQAVLKAITAKSIAASRLSADGKGADQPIADNASEPGRAKNRRVELVRN